MIKMYNVEVLSKFPVVQHFHFGGLFKWERDPTAPTAHAHLSHEATGLPHPGGTDAPQAKPQGPAQTSMPTTVGGTLAPQLREMNIGPIRERAEPPTMPGPTVAPWSRQVPADLGRRRLPNAESKKKA
jgi:serine/threonine-protein phosphatase 2A activator